MQVIVNFKAGVLNIWVESGGPFKIRFWILVSLKNDTACYHAMHDALIFWIE